MEENVEPTGPGDELAELLWDNGSALRRAPPPFQPFTCSAAGSSRVHELKRHAAAGGMAPVPLGIHDAGGLPGLPAHGGADDDAVPWLHCPVVVDDGDADTAPLPPEYCAGLMSEYPGLPAAPPASHGAAVPASRAAPLEAAAKQATPPGAASGRGDGAATNRLRATPLFSEQRMAWLQPPKGPRATAAGAAPAPAPAPQAPLPTEHHLHGEAATVTQRRLQPEARAPDAAAATAVVTTSSVCSGNGDRSQQPKRSSHQVADCSVSADEVASMPNHPLDSPSAGFPEFLTPASLWPQDLDDEGGAMRRSAARSNKRSRTAEVHSLSERIDKASMLEEAIEYLKTLQLQVQMMSMGTGLCVPPMLLPAMQVPAPHPMAHFPHLGMGLGFGMGAAAAFDMARAAGAHFPCPPMAMPPGPMFGVPGQAMPSPAAAAFAHMAGGGTAPAEHIGAAAAAAAAAPPAREDAEPPPAPVVTQV
ncbi:transcription factor APG-like [Panicum miliaceum]|uniref:Transcription factor APG-like n=1 Tax=Panicum miliaceum TaxID=4540 RepID=A0A3L6T2G6_PANMI|nr:transcription factor APG-like [Panicum miliaceum]